MRRTLTLLCFCLCLGLRTALVAPPPVGAQSPAAVVTGFIDGQVTANGATMGYVVYVPRNYTPDKPWPVILFLHGAYADEGDGLGPYAPLLGTLPPTGPYPLPGSIVWGGDLGGAVTRNPQRFPCLVVWPQIPGSNTFGPWDGDFEKMALQALEEVVQKYNGDRGRLYVTGISLGGIGTWNFATDHPTLFAAAMPLCGWADRSTDQVAQALKSLPIWVFHGDKDSLIPVENSRMLVAAVRATGNPNVKYTEYPGVDHNCWDIAYNDPTVIAWLLAQKR
jgi:predicted peptidase